MNKFSPVSGSIEKMRTKHLLSLAEPQEWFLEELVRSGEVWVWPERAYGVLSGDTLVEFHATQSADAPSLLADLKQQRPFQTALCKSFDAGLRDACRALGADEVSAAHLFRKRSETRRPAPDGFLLVLGEESDVEEAYRIGPDFFASLDEVRELVGLGGLWLAKLNGDFVGCGTTYRLGGQSDAVDIGMVVHSDLRQRGLGSAIVNALADQVELAGGRPICGCAKSNAASKRALEKAGFVSEHQLLRFSFPT